MLFDTIWCNMMWALGCDHVFVGSFLPLTHATYTFYCYVKGGQPRGEGRYLVVINVFSL